MNLKKYVLRLWLENVEILISRLFQTPAPKGKQQYKTY